MGANIDLYGTRLLKQGHSYQSGARCIRVVADFSGWLERKGLELDAIDEGTVEQHQLFRTRPRCPFLADRPALHTFLAMLRELHAIAPCTPSVPSRLEQIEQDLTRFLSKERGLARVTIIRHLPLLQRFLRECCADGCASFPKLTEAAVTRFIVCHAHDQSPRSARSMCGTLRAFARYLVYSGHTTIGLASSVPTVRTWRFATLHRERKTLKSFSPHARHCPTFQRDLINSCKRLSR